MCHYIVTSLKDKVGTIILNGPERRSVLGKTTAPEPYRASESYRFNPDVQVVVLRGVSGYLSAGGGITSMRKRMDCYAQGLRPETQTKENAASFSRLILVARQIGRPVVSWIEGACAGGGLSTAIVSDFSIADESYRMTFAFVSVGLTPDMGSSLMLVQRVSPTRVTNLFMTGRRFTGGGAARLGIITQAVSAGNLEQTINALIAKLAIGPAVSYHEIKGAVNRILYPDLYQCMAMESGYVDRPTHVADHAETVYAFLGEKAPRFSGI